MEAGSATSGRLKRTWFLFLFGRWNSRSIDNGVGGQLARQHNSRTMQTQSRLIMNPNGGVARVTVTSSPYSDGYQWRKYGQKRIMRTSFPRCYYRCCYHRERSCPATKLVQQQPQQQHSDGDQTMYTVTYVHEHTCHNMAPAEPEAAARSSTPGPLGFSAGLQPRQQQRGGAGLDRGSKEELERQALVSSLACVLQGHHQSYPGSGAGTPDGSPSHGRAGDGPSASGLSLDTSDDLGLDIMDYGVTDALYFAASSSYGPGGDGMIP
uniref:Putative WRKY transcription factor 53 n=1 Tax=Aegilops tauschii TaxID=37682 RepID=N1R0E6_AEGTA